MAMQMYSKEKSWKNEVNEYAESREVESNWRAFLSVLLTNENNSNKYLLFIHVLLCNPWSEHEWRSYRALILMEAKKRKR